MGYQETASCDAQEAPQEETSKHLTPNLLTQHGSWTTPDATPWQLPCESPQVPTPAQHLEHPLCTLWADRDQRLGRALGLPPLLPIRETPDRLLLPLSIESIEVAQG